MINYSKEKISKTKITIELDDTELLVFQAYLLQTYLFQAL